jgi:tRNA (cytidine32/guanosine34-2'-O)-methyltransferase
LQETAPIDNVHHIVGDITKGETLAKILEAFKGQLCDLVICDGAPDITGFHDMDQYIQSQLLVAALNITVKVLKKGGNFVAKIFKGSEISFLYSQFKLYFREIHIFKYLGA